MREPKLKWDLKSKREILADVTVFSSADLYAAVGRRIEHKVNSNGVIKIMQDDLTVAEATAARSYLGGL